MDYQSPSQDAHLADEERQWAQIVARGDAARGLALVYVQKFCTAAHEFEPAFRAGALAEGSLGHVRGRLVARLDYCLAVMEANGLGRLRGLDELRDIRAAMVAAADLASLVGLTDRIHAANHVVCDALLSQPV